MIPNQWYPVLESARLGRRPVGLERLGKPWVAFRDGQQRAVLLPGNCPHRGAALRMGRVVKGELQCPWHGFRFDQSGQCTAMPCEGEAATIPKVMHLDAPPVAERHGLIWMWWGNEAADRGAIPWFDDVATLLTHSAEASKELPYHYSRMMETNLDIHHTPFTHGSVMPGIGTEIRHFTAETEGDRVRTQGELCRPGKDRGMAFRADALLPCLSLIELTPKLRIVIAATPIDATRTWMWFRYYQDYTNLPGVRRFISWFAVQSELHVVQPQDWRIFSGLLPGTVDDVPYHLVTADKGIALYRKLRRERLTAAGSAIPASAAIQTVAAIPTVALDG
jgi:nitrite reductase/ring-hydroxylating ferredoxin subunit